jgi:small-conductance mechanosensitive channel
MDWTDRVAKILDFRLFRVGGEPVTPVDLVLFISALVLTFTVSALIQRVLEKRLMRHRSFHAGARYTLSRLAQYLLIVVGLTVSLKFLHVDLTALAVVFGALGVGIGFGLQNLVANFVAGLVILFERPIEVGDRIKLDGVEGNVRDISFRSTTVVTNDNIVIIVPNSSILNNNVTNWSHGDPRVRIHVPVGVAYGSDVQKVRETLIDVAKKTEGVLDDPEPAVFFLEFGDSSLNFDLLVWTEDPVHHRRLRSILNFAIDGAFRSRGIEIPFPQRDLHIRSAPGLKDLRFDKPGGEG